MANATKAAPETRQQQEAREFLAANGSVKAQIETAFRAGKMTFDEMVEKLKNLDKKPLTFGVAEKSGWLSIYVDGMRFPINMPVEVADELFSEAGASAARDYIKENRGRFTTREQRQAQRAKGK